MPRIYHGSSNPTLDFVAAIALAPAEVTVDPALMKKYDEELAAVRIIFIILPVCQLTVMLLGRGCSPSRRRRRLVIFPLRTSALPDRLNPNKRSSVLHLPCSRTDSIHPEL